VFAAHVGGSRYEGLVDAPDAKVVSTWDLIVTIRRFHHRLEVAMDQAVEGMALKFAQYRVLELLVHCRHSIHVAEIARRTRVTRQAAQSTVEKLARAGLVDVTSDGYMRYVEISAPGRRRITLCRHAAASVVRDIEGALSREERARLAQLMIRADRSIHPPDSPTWWLDD
jgi:DNA-binding MarR family transcriptional regulator